jgi:tetratricopeptide (TPR) repeat protein
VEALMRPSLVIVLALVLLAPGVSAREFTGENPLGVPADQMARAQEALDLVYQRRYAHAVKEFSYLADDFPTSPLGPLGQSLVWQARMMENYDFRYQEQYYEQYREAVRRLDTTLRGSEMKAWNLFLLGGIVGLEGVQLARQGEYLRALNKGWEALSSLKKAARLNKDFHDPDLGLGIYNYWRTVFTKSIKTLPFFPDRREEGLGEMINARDRGLITRVGASLSLAFTYMERRDFDTAQQEMRPLLEEYPDSVIAHQLMGRIYKAQRKTAEAVAEFERCLEIDPGNNFSVLYLGEVYYRTRRHNLLAERYYKQFLATDAPREQKALAEYRLGQLMRRFDFVDEAIGHFSNALVHNPEFERASERLAEMQARKAEGKGKSRQVGPARPTTGPVKVLQR